MDSSQHNSAAGSIGGNGIINPKSNDASPVDSAANATGSPAEESKQNLNQVINSIDKTLGILHQLYLTVSAYNVSSQFPLLQRMNNLVVELDNMARLGEKCNIQVPMEVLNLIDDGKNPDEFTRDVLNSCISKNQITKGKTDAFKGLRGHLLEELEQAFPEEVEAYRDIRAASAAEAKRLAQAQSLLPNGDVKLKPEI
ncbi:Mediator of RNA polymerase II transcription subunit 10a [Capsicum annuum]|uniref:mediator of RNA polymerase II transcription subunit 10b isoform X2 n=1 Tax=Capsicum annuum TaxID=4072 RepID=UPI0007BEACBE|nr:mediator of RNA polymerase II transcription subunit 10b isoform X2 [Capsicum annuum]KAF3646178.1 Mediator of RNA polymerase II transcription subunit 10a [Capsicum annuum]